MIDFDFNKKCYSCGLCVDICPYDAISLNKNENGFCVPKVNIVKCVNCHLCEKYCIALKSIEKKPFKEVDAYYGYNKDNLIRMTSSSGGYFYEIAKFLLNNGYYICGCIWDDNLLPKHIVSNSIEDIKKMMGSKYVQSNLTGIYKDIRKKLLEGSKVAFFGVPCQIYAMKSIFDNNENIVLVSIVCHGVISRGVWEKYVKEIEEKNGKVLSCNMRKKDRNWKDYGLHFNLENGKQLVSYRITDGTFLRCYTEGLFNDYRCNHCVFKGDQIKADIILGDGWGNNNITKNMDDGKGLSTIIVLTEKGKEIINSLNNNFVMTKTNIGVITRANQRIISPAKENVNTKYFYREYKKGKSIDVLVNRYVESNKIFNRIKKTIKMKLK